MKTLALSIALTISLLTSPLQADECGATPGNLVSNCGFETGDFTNWALTGIDSLPSYQGVAYGVDNLDAHSGLYGAYFGGFNGVLNLSQVIPTVPGTEYRITYWLAQSPAVVAPYLSSFATSFNGVVLFSAGSAPNLPFTRYTFTTLALASQSLLNFGARDDTGFYSLDDISVVPVAVPEPQSLALLLAAALLALAGARFQARTTPQNFSHKTGK